MNLVSRKWHFENFFHPRAIASGLLGFSSGFSFLLVLSTLPVWLKEYDVSKTAIGLFTSFVFLPYALKVLWAPLVDRMKLPVLTKLFGHRRSWSILMQTIILFCIWELAKLNPSENFILSIGLSLTIVLASSTRDLATDAYRVETLNKRLLGAGSALYILGYRIGMLASGAGALYVADSMDWLSSFQVMGGCVVVGLITLLLIPEPKVSKAPEIIEQEKKAQEFLKSSGTQSRFKFVAATLYASVVCPFKELMSRKHWIAILALVFFFKLGDNLVHFMANLFFLDIGFTKTEIAAVSKVFGLIAAIIGGFLGGAAMMRFGTIKTLLIFGIIHSTSHFLYVAQAEIGYNITFLYITIALTNVTGGMCTAAFVAYLTSLCHKSYSMTQYALFSSLWSLGNIVSSTAGGWVSDHTVWPLYFAFATLSSLPGLALLYFIYHKERRGIFALKSKA